MTLLEITTPILDYFARCPIGPSLAFPRVAHDPPPHLRPAIDEQLQRVSDEMVRATMSNKEFQVFSGHGAKDDLEREARIWAISHELDVRVSEYRIRAAQNDDGELCKIPALAGLEPDEDGLLPLNEFTVRHGVLLRNGFSFSILPVVDSSNASYWLTLALEHVGPLRSGKVRLDPFMWGPSDQFLQVQYRMWWWGERLSWRDLMERTGSASGAWSPDHLSRRARHTQYAWIDHESEAQLEIEELHLRDSLDTRGTRYCHVIYDKRCKSVVHLDGAIRILNQEEWNYRDTTHLKDVSKLGTRLKVFRIDEAISGEQMSTLYGSFFVWNYDVMRFFGPESPPPA